MSIERRARAAVAVGVCAASFALVVRAEAPDAKVALTWSAPEACPSEASVRTDIARLLAGSDAPVEARAEVTRAGDRWRVVVSMNGGERRLDAPSCRALAEATALIVAMAVDPARVVRNRTARDASVAAATTPLVVPTTLDDASASDGGPFLDASFFAVPQDAAAPVPPPDAAPPPPPPPPPAPVEEPSKDKAVPPAKPSAPLPDHLFAVTAAAALDLGSLPKPAPGPELTLSFTPAPLRLDAFASFFPSTSTVSGTATFTLVAAGARGCYVARVAGVFELAPCVGAEGASMSGSAHVFQPQNGSSGWFSLDAGLLAAWRWTGSWGLVLRGSAVLPTLRPQFVVDNNNVLHQPGSITGRLSAGIELRF